MPYGTRVHDPAYRDFYAESLTVAGSAGPRNVYPLRRGYSRLLIEPQAAIRWNMGPGILSAYRYTAATAAWTDLLTGTCDIIDRGSTASGTGTKLNNLLSTDFIYIGTWNKHAGLYVSMTASVNSIASVLSMKYSKSDGTFATQAITDGTASAGATLAQSGLVTFNAIPTDWQENTLATLTGLSGTPSGSFFWVQYAVSASLSATVEIAKIAALHVTGTSTPTLAGEYGKANVEYAVEISDAKDGSIELIAQAAGATTANVTWQRR